jgi:5-methylcytosine-specific restriction endonuclease McrA
MAKSKARQELEKDKDFILWLFDSKCVNCGSSRTITIHEIVPLSHGRMAMNWRNRIPLCNPCHDWAHSIGTNNSINHLRGKRRKYIVQKFNLVDTESNYVENLQKSSQDTESLSG